MIEEKIIQIAGVVDKTEALMLQQCGVKYIGFPLRLDIHKQDIKDEEAKRIIEILDKSVNSVLITYLDDAQAISELCYYLGVKIVQIHGPIENNELDRLKELTPGIYVIKSLVIGRSEISVNETAITELTPLVDAFITDTFDPLTRASGATGKIHDWNISRRMVELSDLPVILAGGLTPENVKDAIIKVKPAGVDSHTGVEDRNGRKSREKVMNFIKESEKGFDMIEKD